MEFIRVLRHDHDAEYFIPEHVACFSVCTNDNVAGAAMVTAVIALAGHLASADVARSLAAG